VNSPGGTGGPNSSPSVAELELRAVLDAAVDAVIVIDNHGVIETFSNSARAKSASSARAAKSSHSGGTVRCFRFSCRSAASPSSIRRASSG
jgi:hypothetical protein